MWTRLWNDANLGSGSAALVKSTGLLSAVVLAWSMALAPASNAHEELDTLVKEIMPAVVSIEVNDVGGSGFLISSDGMVVTNHHVIENEEGIRVEMNSGESFTAEVVGSDPNTDMALLQIVNAEGTVFPLVSFGNSDDAEVGETVIAIGNPFGRGISVTRGIVSAIDRQLGGRYDPYQVYIQTDAAINFGNSGGPLFNTSGEVIGVNTAIVPRDPREGGSLGIGFAMTSNLVQDVVDDLKKHGKVRRGWLGVGIQNVTGDIRGAIGVDELTGALVSSVFGDTPAERAGILTGDVITNFNGAEVGDSGELTRLVGQAGPEEEATLTIWRNGEVLTLVVVLEERDEQQIASVPLQEVLPGLQLEEIGPVTRQEFSLDDDVSGILITDVDPESQAYNDGIRAGSILLGINFQGETNVPVQSLEDVRQAIENAREEGRPIVLLRLDTEGRTVFVPLNIEQ